MTSTFDNELRLNEQATGDNSGSWGTVTNANLTLIGEALGYGTEGITTNANTHTSTIADGATDPVRALYVEYTGTLDSACTITIAPNTVNKVCFIENGTSGSQNIIIKQGSGATITIPPGDTKAVYLDGAGSGAKVVDAFASLSVVDLKVQDDLTVTDDVAIGGILGVTGVLTTTAKAVFNGGFGLPDSQKATFGGTGTGDLQIFHDGSNSFISDQGTGNLQILTNQLSVNNAANDEALLQAIQDGAVNIYYNGSKKFETTNTGVAITGGFTATDGSTITTADNTTQLTLTSTDGDAAVGPVLALFRNSASPEDNNITGAIDFNGQNDRSGGSTLTYAQLLSVANDVTDGSEDGTLYLQTAVAGTKRERVSLEPTETIINNESRDLDFRVESNLDTHALFVDGAQGGAVGIGVTPEVWSSTVDFLQVGSAASFWGTTNNSVAIMQANAYFNASNAYKYINTDQATQYLQVDGTHVFSSAVSGSADAAVTFVESLRIDASGNIIIANTGGTLQTTTAASHNTRVGVNAGNSIVANANDNSMFGRDAGTAVDDGIQNTFIGSLAGDGTDDGDNNVALGYATLSANCGNQNTALGSQSLFNSTGSDNTAVGYAAGFAMNSGIKNTAVGSLALDKETQGNKTVAIGYQALTNQIMGADTDAFNVGVGFNAGVTVGTGTNNTFIGALAGDGTDDGANNVAVGKLALSANCADSNTSVGAGSGQVYTGAGMVAVGKDAFTNVTSGASNVAVGFRAGAFATTAASSTFVGHQSGQGLTGARITGNNNTCFGASSGLLLQGAANGNTLVGSSCGAALTTAVANVFIGVDAGSNMTTGGGNIIIGNSDGEDVDVAHQIIMGNSVVGVGQDQFTFGRGGTDSNIAFGGQSVTAPSDERYKEDIATSTAGLSFIKDLRPVTFKWKKEKNVPSDHPAYVEGSDTRVMLSNGETNHGFIAQEVKAVIDNHSEIKDGFKMWTEQGLDADGNSTGGRQRLGTAELIPVLTKAVQELSTALDAALARITTLEG